MFSFVKKSYDFFRETFTEHLVDPWSLAAIGSAAFVVIIYSKRKEAILLSEMDSRSDLMNPSESKCNNTHHYESQKPCNYAVWFDRPLEYQVLSNYIKLPAARVIVLIGIPQSGRSKLASKCVLESYPFDVTHLDVRNSPFDDVNGLESRFIDRGFDFSDLISSFITGLSKTFRGELDVLEEASNDHKNQSEEAAAAESLNRFKTALRRFKHVSLPDDTSHLFFINHMEAFSTLTRDKTGMRALEYFLFWLINLTRDKRNIRVVMTCSPMFFYDWLSDVPLREAIQIVGLGDLPKDEAESAYYSLLNRIVISDEQRENAPEFEKVYERFGGRIHDLSKFVEAFAASNMELDSYSEFGTVVTKFTSVLKPELYSELVRNNISSPVLWETQHIISAWEMLLNAPNNIVSYLDFVEKIPANVFQSLFKHAIITYRPQSNTFQDYELCKSTDTVLFRRRLDMHAARVVYNKYITSQN